MPALAKHGIPGIICLFLASLVTAAIAQVPDRPVRVFIPYAAGGPADVIVRNLAQRITASGGPTFVVENKTGGGGVIAALATKQSPPDGTTLFLTDLPTFAINPNLLADFPLDPVAISSRSHCCSHFRRCWSCRRTSKQTRSLTSSRSPATRRRSRLRLAGPGLRRPITGGNVRQSGRRAVCARALSRLGASLSGPRLRTRVRSSSAVTAARSHFSTTGVCARSRFRHGSG